MKRIFTITVIIALVLELCACGQKAPTWQEQYDLGVRYLSEGNYQEAIIAFTTAIEIDPKRAPAYVGRGDAYIIVAEEFAGSITEAAQLGQEAINAYQNAVKEYITAIELDGMDVDTYRKAAKVYIALGDIDSATAILEQGFQTTEDKSLQEILDKTLGVIIAEDLSEDSEEYHLLENFLSNFGWYWPDYDNNAVTLITNVYDKPTNILELMLSVPFCYSFDSEIYPGENMQLIWDGSDPLGRFAYTGYGKVSIDSIDWTLKNILNCKQSDIAQMKKPILSNQNEDIYCQDGYYYFSTPGIGGGYVAKITDIEPSGLRYYVNYNLNTTIL